MKDTTEKIRTHASRPVPAWLLIVVACFTALSFILPLLSAPAAVEDIEKDLDAHEGNCDTKHEKYSEKIHALTVQSARVEEQIKRIDEKLDLLIEKK